MTRVVALIQARMGSTRFPGKMLAELGEAPVLEWVLRRTNKARLVDQVVLATTDLHRDNALVELAEKLGIEVFRGSESDVLGRFATAAALYKADTVVRICADNPFIDPDEIDRLVIHFSKNSYDYACNHQERLGNRYADGFGAEILSNSLLQTVAQLATDLGHREHATLYLWDHAKEYHVAAVSAPPELAYPELRFDVDTAQDLESLKDLVAAGINIESTAPEIVKLALKSERATLVTTDITKSSDKSNNKYFLGAWCFVSRHDEHLARKAGRIIPYHWDDREKLKKDFYYLQRLNNAILEDLVIALNQLHGTNRDKKFWNLLLGYWLNIYTAVVFDRWSSLEQVARQEKNWTTEILSVEENELAVNDTEEFIKVAGESSVWNHLLFSQILEHLPEIKKENIKFNKKHVVDEARSKAATSKSKNILKKIASRISSRIKKTDHFFLIGTYLPIRSLIRLELGLGQWPVPIFQLNKKIESKFDARMRQWSLIFDSNEDKFASIVRELLPKYIPRVFVEGFNDLFKSAQTNQWAEAPEVIFTSNSHFTDDVFKAWAAVKISQGARLVIGEHGGLGVGLFNGAHEYELSVADSYLSTGWSNSQNDKILKIGNFRKVGQAIRPNLLGNALMVCLNMPRFSFDIRSMALSSQMLSYFEDQFSFVDALPAKLRDKILVRLYPSDYGWEQKERWKDRHPNIKFDNSRSILKSTKESRLFIGTYAATTYIDTLTLNFPTVMFWNPCLWEIKEEARAVFVLLKNAGIFHETPQSAANHISEIWDNISGWWESDIVQNARRSFCAEFSSMPVDLMSTLEETLLGEAERSTTSQSR